MSVGLSLSVPRGGGADDVGMLRIVARGDAVHLGVRASGRTFGFVGRLVSGCPCPNC